MTGWEIFYLVCFMVGVALSLITFLSGSFHLPQLHVHVPHVHLPHGGHGASPTDVAHGGFGQADLPFINFGTVTAFLAWFGGTGYLLSRHSTLVVGVILILSMIAGIVGAAVVFYLIAKLLLKHERWLDPADYERVGVLGRVISPVRQGGTGEMIFSQEGTRHTCGVRSDAGEALEKGVEVIITRYEKGIAYVRRWEEMANGKEAASG
jgi:membrane-bound ClpP family serine protease